MGTYISTPISFDGVEEKWHVISEVKEDELYDGMFKGFFIKDRICKFRNSINFICSIYDDRETGINSIGW